MLFCPCAVDSDEPGRSGGAVLSSRSLQAFSPLPRVYSPAGGVSSGELVSTGDLKKENTALLVSLHNAQ